MKLTLQNSKWPRLLVAGSLSGLVYCASGLIGCASVNSVSLTPIPANRGKSVRANAEKWIFLGFSFDNDFIDPVVEDLKNQCPNGVVSGILTKDETYSYFLLFRRQLTATGFCSSGLAQNQNSKRRTASGTEL